MERSESQIPPRMEAGPTSQTPSHMLGGDSNKAVTVMSPFVSVGQVSPTTSVPSTGKGKK